MAVVVRPGTYEQNCSLGILDPGALGQGNNSMTRSPEKNSEQAVSRQSSRRRPDANVAAQDPGPGAEDRPGFDLGGAVTDATAGSGLGLGDDAAESRQDRRLPRRRPKSTPIAPRGNEK